MKYFQKPRNPWGWARLAVEFMLVGVALWTMAAALMRAAEGPAWMAWSGYPTFSIQQGLELVFVLLLGTVGAEWMEEQDAKTAAEQQDHHEREKALAVERRKAVRHIHEMVKDSGYHTGGVIAAAVLAALPELDGKGKGELLQFLYEKGLLTGEAGLDLHGADLSGVVLQKAHLKGARLQGVNLSGGRMEGAHLVGADLTGSQLGKAFLRHADLREAVLRSCDFGEARLEHANLERADLSGAGWKGAFLMDANLSGTTVDERSLDEAVLVETLMGESRRVINEKGKEYRQKKEIETLVDRL